MSGFTPRYGLGYDQLKDDFPQLIYCSITGFGHSGPYSKRPALRHAHPGIVCWTGRMCGRKQVWVKPSFEVVGTG